MGNTLSASITKLERDWNSFNKAKDVVKLQGPSTSPESLTDTHFGQLFSESKDGPAHVFMPKRPHWSIPWADLMMSMFILFAVLFVYHASKREYVVNNGESTIDQSFVKKNDGLLEKPVTDRVQPNEITGLYRKSKQTLKAENLEKIASVDLVEDKAVRIILTGDVLFDTGKAELKPESLKTLKKVAGILKDTPYMVNIVGHTDDVPIHTERFPTNWELSSTRACVTARFLIEETNIPPSQVYAVGRAAYQPMRSNDSPKGRRANRRVVIFITKENSPGTYGISPASSERN